ncbi:MAG: LD-carboxypeptidase, partial [Ferruginibacter sp.]
KKANYTCRPHSFNKNGTITAQLVGGNLSLLAHLTGTPDDINTKGKILFIEDIGEQIYNVDRMLYQLKRSGKLQHLAGLIVGGFTDMEDTERPFGKKIYAVINDIVGQYNYPVCYNFPVSHQKENLALKIGSEYRLTITKNITRLLEV